MIKFKTVKGKIQDTYTRDGKTVPVTKKVKKDVPVLPRDLQALATKAAIAMVLGLTTIAVVWSTYSIGALLDGGIGYLAAVIFDLGWAIALILEYMARYDESKRQFPERLGWFLLAITMGAIAWHGVSIESYGLAVLGAFVSFFAKVLWIGIMKHINAKLSDEDKAWLAAQISEAQSKAAVAEVRRQSARTEQRAALALLAMEQEKRQVAEAFGIDLGETFRAEQIEQVEPKTERLALEAPTLADMNKSDAIRFVRSRHPELEATEVAELLNEQGVDVKVDYVTTVFRRIAKPELEEAEELAEVVNLRK